MKINLDINRSEPILETINLRQGDGGLRTIDIQIRENNQPISVTGYTLQFEANLPSGSMVQNSGVIKDATAGLFSYTFTSSDTSEAGQLPVAYFRLYDANNNSVATRNIRIVVDRAADITQPQANDYLGGIDTLTAETKAKLESNNQQIAAQQTQIDSIKTNGLVIGGRNYLSNSDTLGSGWVKKDQANAEIFELINEPGISNTVLHIKNMVQQSGIGLFNYPAQSFSVGDIITQSIMLRGHGKLRFSFYGITGTLDVNSDTYDKFYVTGAVTIVTNKAFTIYTAGTGETWSHSPQVERYSYVSDWSPNPDDIKARVAALETQIRLGGGRNLARGTETWDKNSFIWQSTQVLTEKYKGSYISREIGPAPWRDMRYRMSDLIDRGLLIVGQKYTVSIWARLRLVDVLSTDYVRGKVVFYGDYMSGSTSVLTTTLDTEWQRLSITTTCTSVEGVTNIRFERPETDGLSYFEQAGFTINFGGEDLGYSLAPEDTPDAVLSRIAALEQNALN